MQIFIIFVKHILDLLYNVHILLRPVCFLFLLSVWFWTINMPTNSRTKPSTNLFTICRHFWSTTFDMIFNKIYIKIKKSNKIHKEKKSSYFLDPPVVKVSPPEVVTNTSEIVLLNCEYVANPASLINVVW